LQADYGPWEDTNHHLSFSLASAEKSGNDAKYRVKVTNPTKSDSLKWNDRVDIVAGKAGGDTFSIRLTNTNRLACYTDSGDTWWVLNGDGLTNEQCSYRFENPRATYGGIKTADGSNRFLNHERDSV